uniref:Uncharacterized protein n=1 Tax=Amblyomma parvum TaxID=251391 RepID=A0A023FZ43_AMBPA
MGSCLLPSGVERLGLTLCVLVVIFPHSLLAFAVPCRTNAVCLCVCVHSAAGLTKVAGAFRLLRFFLPGAFIGAGLFLPKQVRCVCSCTTELCGMYHLWCFISALKILSPLS